jgi:DNA-binding PadR family transcriptional regulator
VLKAGPAHGYAVITALRERSGGEFDLPEGTVYPALHQLERQGLVTSAWDTSSGRRRRVYSLTRGGASALGVRAAEWQSFRRGVQAVLAVSV